MEQEAEKTAGQEHEKDEAALERLRQLKQKLRSGDISRARRAAYNLSWLQEDGLEILTETLVGNFSRTAKAASTYGLRNMKGRMKKMALEVLEKGLNHSSADTKAVCGKALALMRGEAVKESSPHKKKRKRSRPRIQGIRKRGRRSTQWNRSSSRR